MNNSDTSPAEARMLFKCPLCRCDVEADKNEIGKKVFCETCGEWVEVPPESTVRHTKKSLTVVIGKKTQVGDGSANATEPVVVAKGRETASTIVTQQYTSARKMIKKRAGNVELPTTGDKAELNPHINQWGDATNSAPRTPVWSYWILLVSTLIMGAAFYIFYDAFQMKATPAKVVAALDEFVDDDVPVYAPVFYDDNSDEEARIKRIKADGARMAAFRMGIARDEEVRECMKVVKKYVGATTVAEKLACVDDPETIASLLPTWVSNAKKLSPEKLTIIDIVMRGGVMILAMGESQSDVRYAVFCFDKERNAWVMDWFAWEQWGEMSAEEFHQKKPSTPVTMRVLASIGRQYTPGYSDSAAQDNIGGKAYLNLAVRYESGEMGNVYIDRASPDATALSESLRTGAAAVLVQLAYPQADASAPVVVKVVRMGWLGDKMIPRAEDLQDKF